MRILGIGERGEKELEERRKIGTREKKKRGFEN